MTQEPETEWPPKIDSSNYEDYRQPKRSAEEWEDFHFRMPRSLFRQLTTLAANPAVRAFGIGTAADLGRAGVVAITRAIQNSLDLDDPQFRYTWKREQLRARAEFLDEQADRVQSTLEHLSNYLMGLMDTEDFEEQERTLREFVAWADELDPVWRAVYLRELTSHPAVATCAEGLTRCGRDLYWMPKGENDADNTQ